MASQAFTRDGVEVCTLGMFIIDEIDYVHTKGSKLSIIGGAGTYVALGARLVAGQENSDTVGWIVDVGSDFPKDFRTTLEAWKTRCIFREDMSRLTTRAWNGYDENEERAFKYLTPKVRLEAHSLPESHLFAEVFHMVCSGARCKQLVNSILDRRREVSIKASTQPPPRPIFVWEPIPDLCVPTELDAFWEAAHVVDVVSPNEGELCGYFGLQKMTDCPKDSGLTVAESVMKEGIGPERNGTLVVRTGSRGCTAFIPEGSIQMPAYFAPDESQASSQRVVDPTGGGNTFLGGFCKALVGKTSPSREDISNWLTSEPAHVTGSASIENKRRIISALVHANVAAGFAIEQQGMPKLSDAGGNEVWNGEAVKDRVRLYVERIKAHILGQKFL